MKLKYEMSVLDIDNEKTAVPLDSGESFRGVLQMNDTTARIVELLKDETTADAIVSAMLEEYDAPRERIQASVDRVLAALRQNGLLTE